MSARTRVAFRERPDEGDRIGWLPAAAELLLDRWAVAGYDAVEDRDYPERVGRVLEIEP